MDHLGIREFFYMGYCIGGCFAGKLMQRAPSRVVAAVFCQSVGHRPENPTVMYRHSKENWVVRAVTRPIPAPLVRAAVALLNASFFTLSKRKGLPIGGEGRTRDPALMACVVR
jgi:pimeloyl-ACP methyl ester carboxylesterase